MKKRPNVIRKWPISSCYSFFSHSMGNDQYAPKGALQKAESRLFTQFHAHYPLKEKQRIIDGRIKAHQS